MENRTDLLRRIMVLKERSVNECRMTINNILRENLANPKSMSDDSDSDSSSSDFQASPSGMTKKVRKSLRTHNFNVAGLNLSWIEENSIKETESEYSDSDSSLRTVVEDSNDKTSPMEVTKFQE